MNVTVKRERLVWQIVSGFDQESAVDGAGLLSASGFHVLDNLSVFVVKSSVRWGLYDHWAGNRVESRAGPREMQRCVHIL